MQRLRRLSAITGDDIQPTFSQFLVPRNDSRGLPVDIPVLRVTFSDRVFFNTGSAEVRGDSLAIIRVVAESLAREPSDVAVFVAGHTDSRGSNNYNYNLSIDRSNSVAEALLAHGINQAQVWRVGFGEAMPIVPNTSEVHMAQNRRVEFHFAAKPTAIAHLLSKQAHAPCVSSTSEESLSCRFVAQRVAIVRRASREISTDRTPSRVVTEAETVETTTKVTPGATVPLSSSAQSVDLAEPDAIEIDLHHETFEVGAPIR